MWSLSLGIVLTLLLGATVSAGAADSGGEARISIDGDRDEHRSAEAVLTLDGETLECELAASSSGSGEEPTVSCRSSGAVDGTTDDVLSGLSGEDPSQPAAGSGDCVEVGIAVPPFSVDLKCVKELIPDPWQTNLDEAVDGTTDDVLSGLSGEDPSQPAAGSGDCVEVGIAVPPPAYVDVKCLKKLIPGPLETNLDEAVERAIDESTE